MILSFQQIVNTYADDSSGTVVFTFNSTTITLNGVTSTNGLENAIDIF